MYGGYLTQAVSPGADIGMAIMPMVSVLLMRRLLFIIAT